MIIEIIRLNLDPVLYFLLTNFVIFKFILRKDQVCCIQRALQINGL